MTDYEIGIVVGALIAWPVVSVGVFSCWSSLRIREKIGMSDESEGEGYG